MAPTQTAETPTDALSLDLDRLRELAQLTSDDGVLTVVLGHDPHRPDAAKTAETALHSGLRDARAACEGDLKDRLEARLEELQPQLDDLVDPTTFGQGRILVTTLTPGADVHVIRVQSPVEHRVVVAEHAWIRPLARLWADHRPVRILLLDQEGIQVRDWVMGRLVDRWDREVAFGDAQLADIKSGPAKSPHQRGHVNKERFEDRLDANRERILRDAVAEAVESAKSRAIDRVLVLGPHKVRAMVEPELQNTGLDVWTDDRDLSQSSDQDLAEVVRRHALEAQARQSQDLIAAILEADAAGGPATVGLAGVLRALNEGRVDQLVVSTDADIRGYVTDAGLLSVTPGPEREHDPEPFLLDRTVAAALLTDARVVPVPDEQAAQLGDEPIGAMLRW